MDDEINLGEYARLLWRKRRVITLVTLAAVAVAAAASLFVLKPVYEASTVLLVSEPRFQAQAPTASPTTSLQARPTTFTVDYLIPLVHNEVVAAQVAPHLPGESVMAPAALVKSVRFTPVRATNLLKLTARSSSPAGAVATARAWSAAIVEYVDSLGQEEIRRSLSVLEQKIASTAEALDQSEKALRDFRADSKIPILEQRVQEIVRRVALHETRLAEIEQGGAPAGGEVTLQPSGGTYTLGVASVRNPTQIRKILAALRRDLADHQQALATERQRETQLLRQVDVARSTYELLVQKREEMRILLGANAGMVKIAVPPILPESPAAPRTVLNITLAGILGLMAGTMLAFVLEYLSVPASVAMPHPVSGAAPRPDREKSEAQS